MVLLVAAAALLVRRDLGAGVLATRLGPAAAPPWLRSPLALAWRLQRGALAGWAVGAAVAGLSFGVIAQDMVQFAAEDPETAELLASLGGSGSIADIYLAAILSWIGMLAAGYAVQATLRLRAEEAELRAEQVLATATPRTGWAGSHLVVAAVGAAVVLAAGGLLAGLAHGLRAGDLGGELPRVLGGALVQLPAVWVMAAVGAALFGLLPRLVVGATWAVLAVVLFVTDVRGAAPAQPVAARPVAVRPPAEAAGGRVHGDARGLAAGRRRGSWPPPAWPASAAATWSAAPDRGVTSTR